VLAVMVGLPLVFASMLSLAHCDSDGVTPVCPVEVMTQPELVRASVTCSRPICVPLMKMPNDASPGAGDGAAWADAVPAAASRAAAARAVQ
jgi:hypothetical protein